MALRSETKLVPAKKSHRDSPNLASERMTTLLVSIGLASHGDVRFIIWSFLQANICHFLAASLLNDTGLICRWCWNNEATFRISLFESMLSTACHKLGDTLQGK